jgi:hypothetical protein
MRGIQLLPPEAACTVPQCMQQVCADVTVHYLNGKDVILPRQCVTVGDSSQIVGIKV